MDKKTGIIVSCIIAVFVLVIGISLWQKNSQNLADIDYGEYKVSAIK